MNAAIEEQLIEAKVAEVKSTGNHGFSVFKTGDSEVDSSVEGGRMAFTTNAADKVWVYSTENGEPREILVNMLAKTLKKKRAGKAAFSLTPMVEYRRGNKLCMLHPDHPDRELFVSLGVTKICGEGTTAPAGKLASDLDVRTHMEHRHKREWLTIQEHFQQVEKQEDRDRQDRLAEAMLKAVESRSESLPFPDGTQIHSCAIGGCKRFFDSSQGLAMHRTKEHGGG